MINSVSSFKFSSTSLGQSKSKQKTLGSLMTIMFSSMIIMTWLNRTWLYDNKVVSFSRNQYGSLI